MVVTALAEFRRTLANVSYSSGCSKTDDDACFKSAINTLQCGNNALGWFYTFHTSNHFDAFAKAWMHATALHLLRSSSLGREADHPSLSENSESELMGGLLPTLT
jgi:hypothetical protein